MLGENALKCESVVFVWRLFAAWITDRGREKWMESVAMGKW